MLLRCLCCECLAVRDAFNRADESITTANQIPGTDWFWETGGIPNSISSNELVIDDTSFIKLRPDTGVEGVPRQFQFEIDVKIPQDSKTIRIEYHCILDTVEEAEFHLELLSSDGSTGACGAMRLTDGSTALTDWIQVSGLDAGSFVTIELCYSAEQQILTATVAGVSVKVTGAAAATPVNGTTNESEIWLVPDDPTLPTFFENMRLRKIRTLVDGDYGDADNCPLCDCARTEGCSTESDDFEDAAIDCRWVEEDGSWTEGDVDGEGCLYTGSDDALIVRKTHGCGFDGGGEIDNTVKVAVSLHTLETGLENEAKIFFDFVDIDNCHWVLIRFADNADSNEVTVNGRMEVWSSTDGMLDSKDWGPTNLLPGLPYSVTVCFDGETVIADIGTGDPLEVEAEAFGGPFTGLGTGTINAGTVFFHSWDVNRDIYNSECGDCLDNETPVECCNCEDEEAPPYLVLELHGFRTAGSCAACLYFNGTFAVPFVFDTCDFPLVGPIVCNDDAGNVSYCQWGKSIARTVCAPTAIVGGVAIRIAKNLNTGEYFVSVLVGMIADPGFVSFVAYFCKSLGVLDEPPNCFDIFSGEEGMVLEHLSTSESDVAGWDCEADEPTATIRLP